MAPHRGTEGMAETAVGAEAASAPLQIPVENFARLFGLAGGEGDPHWTLFAEATQGRETIGLADCFRLLRRLAFTAGEETFSLSARPMVSGTAEFVLSRASGAATIGEALRQIASGYNVLHGSDYNRVERRSGQLIYALHDETFPYTRPRDDYLHFALECALIFVHAVVCELAQADLSASVRRISTRRSDRSGPGASALGFWRAPVCLGAGVYAVAYDAALEQMPVLGLRPGLAPDLSVHNRIVSLIEHPLADAAGERLAAEVRQVLEAGAADQEAVARALGMSVATLRRRLSEENTSFRALRQQAMNAYARNRVLETRDIATVAEELGFSDPRAFTRAFKTWNGMTPSDYRAQANALSENVP
jgi:AraC-like DNA-binding protein